MKNKAFFIRVFPWPLLVILCGYLAFFFDDSSPLALVLGILFPLTLIGLVLFLLFKNRDLLLGKSFLAFLINLAISQAINWVLVGLPFLTITDPLTGRIHSWQYAIDVFDSGLVIAILLALALILDTLFILSYWTNNRR